MENIILEQKRICRRYGVEFMASPDNMKVGIALNVKEGEIPINAMRDPQEADTTGWYIWSGDLSDDPDFFKPLDIVHLREWCPWIEKYLGLASGMRFLVTPDYEDVWQDLTLLDI
ncbi:immunity protein Imm33 domain-containing protein [Roseivirga sp.]|uniref:immunity protein Imm33 domain-containing protein n=1 Tax=Roseivirga sp. TaxID=1964215 RepID=UPI003B8ADF9E